MSLLPRILALSLVVFLPVGFVCSNAELPEQKSAQETVLERFKLPRDSKILLLPVEVKGKKYNFVLDTASTVTCYDTSLRSFLGDPVRSGTVHTKFGEMKTTVFLPPTAKLGHSNLPTKSPVGCVDFGRWREFVKEEIYGALGMDFLKEHILRIDFGRAEVSLLRSVDLNPGVRIPITFERNAPQVELTFPGRKEGEKFLVDTGYVGIDGFLRAELFDDFTKRGFLTIAGESKIETALGSASWKQGHVEAITLGNFRHKNLLFARSKLSTLCLYYWAEYDVVTFDFPGKAIYLKKKSEKKGKDADSVEKEQKPR